MTDMNIYRHPTKGTVVQTWESEGVWNSGWIHRAFAKHPQDPHDELIKRGFVKEEKEQFVPDLFQFGGVE